MRKFPRALLFLPLLATLANSALAQSAASRPQPAPENRQLAVFLGIWKDEAVFSPSPISLAGKMTLIQTCDWFQGGFSLVCHTDTTGFMGEINSVTIIAYDVQAKQYTHFELNSLGYAAISKGSFDAGLWTFTRAYTTGGKTFKIRSTIKLPTADTALMSSEVSVDGGPWSPIMELKGTRIKQGTARFDQVPAARFRKRITTLVGTETGTSCKIRLPDSEITRKSSLMALATCS